MRALRAYSTVSSQYSSDSRIIRRPDRHGVSLMHPESPGLVSETSVTTYKLLVGIGMGRASLLTSSIASAPTSALTSASTIDAIGTRRRGLGLGVASTARFLRTLLVSERPVGALPASPHQLAPWHAPAPNLTL